MGNWIQYNEDENRFNISIDDGETFEELDLSGHTLIPEPEITEAPLTQQFKNLYLRTDPELDYAFFKIKIESLDEWIADDGTRVTDTLSNNKADITTSGAGGLDTGSETASSWYEIYRIRKSSDGTLNTLLHRAKDYFIDYNKSTISGHLALRSASTSTKVGQTFVPGTTGKIEYVEIQLQKVGSISGKLWAELQDNSGTILATSQEISCSLISTGVGTWATFIFRSPYSVTSGTTYRMALAATFTINASNYMAWNGDTADVYASGTGQYYNGTSWSNVTLDAAMKVFITRNESNPTMPTGYDQKCFLGYVYNNSGSNFVFFSQFNRTCRPSTNTVSGSISSAVPVIIDFSACLPPSKYLKVGLSSSNGSTHIFYFSGVPDGIHAPFGSLVSGDNGYICAIGAIMAFVGYVFTSFQRIYAFVSGNSTTVFVSEYEYMQ